jgi:folate-binding protein YgfZ
MPENLANPLRTLHEAAGAEFQPYATVEIVSTFGEPQAEYSALHKACGLLDLPQCGVLELTGKDRLPFLNNLLTNQTWDKATKSGLASGRGVYAYYLNAKGRIVADMNVLEIGDGRTYLAMDARMVEPVRVAFDKYLFVEQVKMTSLVGKSHEIALMGPKAKGILDQITTPAVGDLPPLGCAAVTVFSVRAVVFRDDVTGTPGYSIITEDLGGAEAVWTALLNQFGDASGIGKRGLRPVGWAAFNAARIEAGRPVFDIDFGNSADPEKSVVPAEVGPREFARAVSVTKGCYIGQEIVARMYARQQVARQLVGFKVEGDHLPIAGAALMDEQQNQIGVVTSSTVSPILSNAAIGLGYVKRPHFAEGTTLHVPAEGAIRKAIVVKTPFVEV